jgi:type I restriction enzyme S subunit
MSEPLNPLKGKDDVLANGWRETTLADLCTDISYGYTESAKQKKVGPKFLRITDIASGRLDWKNVPYCPINESDFEKYKLLPGDIVIARTGATTGANYTIKKSDPKDVVFASYLIRYKINPQIANPYYIGQLLRSPNWSDYVDAIAGGSAQPGANAKQLGSFDILLPPLPEQKAIASVLSSLDDKIDLLHRQNKTLEQMAETLFRQWFVEEADEGWEEIELRELCKVITKGTTPTSLKKSFVDSGINFIKVNCIDKNGNYLFDKFNFIDEETHFSVLKRSILKQDDILYSIAGTIGRAVTVTKNVLPANVNQALAIIRVDEEKINPTFVKYALKDKDITFNLHSKIVHAVQPNLSLGEIGSTILPMPDFTALEKFNSVVNPIEHKINFNKSNIQTLEKLRDTLLPKLMSGKVRVKMEE